MTERYQANSDERTNWLAPSDQKFYVQGVGLTRTLPVDGRNYDLNYFSGNHLAYPEGYDRQGRQIKYADALINIMQFLGQPVLELGCGPGYLVEGLAREEIQIQGVDLSKTAIDHLSPHNIRHLLLQSSLTKLPFHNQTFHSGYSFHVLEHLTPNELELAIAEITRTITTKLYLIIPTWDSLTNYELFTQIVADPTHRVIVNRDWWLKKFAEYGWKHNDQLAQQLDRLKRGWVFFFEK